eukprot:g588.t1
MVVKRDFDKWKQDLIYEFSDPCTYYKSTVTVVFESCCAFWARLVWSLVMSVCVFYLFFVVKLYRRQIDAMSRPILSINNDAVIFDLNNQVLPMVDDENDEGFRNPKIEWCRGNPLLETTTSSADTLKTSLAHDIFYIPYMPVPNFAYMMAENSTTSIPFTARSSCLTPLHSRSFITHASGEEIKIPTSIVALDSGKASFYTHEPFKLNDFVEDTKIYYLTSMEDIFLEIDFVTSAYDVIDNADWSYFSQNSKTKSSDNEKMDDSFFGFGFDIETVLLASEEAGNTNEFLRAGKSVIAGGEARVDAQGALQDSKSNHTACRFKNNKRVIVTLQNILDAAGFSLNEENPIFRQDILHLVDVANSQQQGRRRVQEDTNTNQTLPLKSNSNLKDSKFKLKNNAAFPYRLSGATILLNIHITNFCAGKYSIFDGDFSDFRAQMNCYAQRKGLDRLEATITATKLDDYGLLQSSLKPRATIGSALHHTHGINIIVQTDPHLYEVDLLQTTTGWYPYMICLLLVYITGLKIIDCCLYIFPDTGLCCRVRIPCRASKERKKWKNILDSTGFSSDPLDLKFWTFQDKEKAQSSVAAKRASNVKFHSLGAEPDWSQDNGRVIPHHFKRLSEKGIDLDVHDVDEKMKFLSNQLKETIEKEIYDTALTDQIDFQQIDKKNRTQQENDRLKLLKRRLDAKSEALTMLTMHPPNENVLRAMLLECFEVLDRVEKRKLLDIGKKKENE